MRSRPRWILRAALAASLLLALPREGPARDAGSGEGRWSGEVVGLAESLPVQEGGRIKPLHTYASFTLLRMNGRRSVATPAGERLSAVEWLLDVLFYPRVANTYPIFLVQNPEVIGSIGVSPGDKRRRDRYSLDELQPGIDRLFQLASQYHRIEEKQRTSVQHQIFLLANNVRAYLDLAATLDFARHEIPVASTEALREVFDGRAVASVSGVLERLGPLLELRRRSAAQEGGGELDAVSEVLFRASDAISRAETLALIPPPLPAGADAAWRTPADVFFEALHDGRPSPEAIGDVAALEDLVGLTRDGEGAFDARLAELHGRLTERAAARGEYEKVGLELTYYKSKVLSYSHYGFVLSFLLTAFLWLRPRSKALHGATSLAVLGSTLLLIGAITMRCLIRGRPPVSTLYETVLFVTAVGAVIGLFIEAVDRRRIAVSAAALLGTIGLFIANGYEMLDKRDTMPSLVAVLDTNFWLATHVTAITTGYSAGMLAALLASIYLVSKAIGWRRSDPAFHRSLGRMVYGVLCFALIFSIVGTILGGIWANDSWGRFWGWDPKENGALLIVLSQLMILHARMGGYLREHGMCMAAAFGGTIIAFSWWGVNLLGVGLHSYGFTSGINSALWTYYGIQWGIVGLGGIHWLRARAA